MIGVVGTLRMFGAPPNVIFSRLSLSANTGDTTIKVDDAVDWIVGDLIGIGPTGHADLYVNDTESFIITAISADKKTLTLNSSI